VDKGMLENLGAYKVKMHYNKRGVYCDPNIIANNKEKSF
jgi:hypothetical protein